MTSYDLYSDLRVKYLQFPEANAGSVVGYEYIQKHRPFVFEDDWSFQGTIPTRRAHFSLQIPTGWEFTNRWANYPDQKTAILHWQPICLGGTRYPCCGNRTGNASHASGGCPHGH